MGIGIDAEHAPEFQRCLMPPPIEIQTPRVGIDLNSHSILSTRGKDPLDIHFVSRSAQQLTTGHMSENGGVRVRHRAYDPIGLRFPILAELAMHARDDKIEGL